MTHPRGESDFASRIAFDRRMKLEFHGSSVTSDTGLLAYRELDDALGLTKPAGGMLMDGRRGRNTRHMLVGLLRQSIFGRLAGYEDGNEAERLARACDALDCRGACGHDAGRIGKSDWPLRDAMAGNEQEPCCSGQSVRPVDRSVSCPVSRRSFSYRGSALLCELQLPGAELGHAAPRGSQSRVASGRASSPRRLHRDQPVAPGRKCRRLLQLARHGGTVEQGRQEHNEVDTAVLLLLLRERRAAPGSRAGIQSRQLRADAGPAGNGEALVVNQSAGQAR